MQGLLCSPPLPLAQSKGMHLVAGALFHTYRVTFKIYVASLSACSDVMGLAAGG